MQTKIHFTPSGDSKTIKKLVNKTFKLLPTREEEGDYIAQINILVEELKAIRKVEDNEKFFNVQYKLELLKEKTDYKDYRKLIFEIINDLKGE